MSGALAPAGASAAAIQHHYDVGTEFYRLWLDARLHYSCALFEGDESLEEAQRRKLAYHVRGSGAAGQARVLDVGCGWGATLAALVGEFQVGRATGLTLSRDQAAHVNGFADPRIEVRLESWEEHQPEQAYDSVISIGAFEHFAQVGLSRAAKVARYREFFTACSAWLRPGGQLSLQSITYENADAAEFSEFFGREIFPESDLPRLAEMVEALDRRFEILELRLDRAHYVRTLKQWHRRFRSNREAIEALVGPAIYQRYDKYLQMAMLGFHIGTMNLVRLSARRLQAR